MLQFSPDDTSQELRLSFQSELVELIMNIIRMLSHDEDNNTHLSPKGKITTHFPKNKQKKY